MSPIYSSPYLSNIIIVFNEKLFFRVLLNALSEHTSRFCFLVFFFFIYYLFDFIDFIEHDILQMKNRFRLMSHGKQYNDHSHTVNMRRDN